MTRATAAIHLSPMCFMTTFPWLLKPASASLFSHSIMAEVFVVQTLEPFAEFFGGGFGAGGGFFGGFQDFFFDEDGAIYAQRERERVRRTRVYADDFAVALHPDYGIEGVFF